MNFTVFSTTLHDLAYRVSDSKWQYVVGSWKTWRAGSPAQCWVWKVFRPVDLLIITSLVGSTGRKSWKTWRASQARLVLFGRAGSFSAATATARVALLRRIVSNSDKKWSKNYVSLIGHFSQRQSKVEMVKIQNPDFSNKAWENVLSFLSNSCHEVKNKPGRKKSRSYHFHFCLSLWKMTY